MTTERKGWVRPAGAIAVLLMLAATLVTASLRPADAAARAVLTAAPAPAPAIVAGAGGPAVAGNSGLIPITPQRILETRVGPLGGTGALRPFETRGVSVLDAVGVGAAQVGAVVLNVTVAGATVPGFVTVCQQAPCPVTSTVNYVPGQVVPNGTVIGVDGSGRFQVFNGSAGATEVVIDITGWIPAGAGFNAVTPTRVLETRPGLPGYEGGGPFAQHETRTVNVVGRAGLPAGAVGAVAINLTVDQPSGPGFLKAWPTGAAQPPTSSLNWTAGAVVANSAVLGVGADGTISLETFNTGRDAATDSTNVIVDVTGYFAPDRTFQPVTPTRIFDSREGGDGPLVGGETYGLKVDALGNLPRGFAGAVAVNVTIDQPTAPGFLTTWPLADTTARTDTFGRPLASSVNFVAGQTVANTVLVGVGVGIDDLDGDGESDISGVIGLFVNAGRAHVVVDITGYFPQDTLGLLADSVDARRYGVGVDRVAVMGCSLTPTQQDGVVNALGGIAAFYQRLSTGHYQPAYTMLGSVALGTTYSDNSCLNAAANAVPAGQFDSLLVVRDKPVAQGGTAYGFATPGEPCRDPSCLRLTFPDTFAFALATLNTLIGGVGPNLPATPSPYTFITAHEFGHTLDWPHSYTGVGGCFGGQYDNPLDLLSRPPTNGQCQGGTFSTVPARTLALKRYAAGWMDPSLALVHNTSGTTYTLGALGSGSPELLVVRSADGAAYTTLEVRVGGQADDDNALSASGVAVHRIDQRAGVVDQFGVQCQTVTDLGLDRCSGLDRREQPYGPGGSVPDSYQHLLQPGQSLDLGGVAVTVTGRPGTLTYTVQVTGTVTAAFPIVKGHTQVVLGRVAADEPQVVCLVGARVVDSAGRRVQYDLLAGRTAGRSVPTTRMTKLG